MTLRRNRGESLEDLHFQFQSSGHADTIPRLTRAASRRKQAEKRDASPATPQSPLGGPKLLQEEAGNAKQLSRALTVAGTPSWPWSHTKPSTTPNLSEIIARELEEVETHQPSTPTTTRRPRNRKAPFQSHHQREDPGSTCAREVMLGEPVPSSSYHPGMIFLALHAEPAWTVKWSKKCPSTGFMKNTPYGRVMVKQRFFVVVARWHEHCVALPMFTHQGVGVARKPHRNEFVPVRDHRSTQSSPQMPYLWTKEMSDGAVVLHPLTHVQMSRPVSRDYSVPVTVMGRLDQRSMVLLVAMYAEYVRSALEMQVSGAL